MMGTPQMFMAAQAQQRRLQRSPPQTWVPKVPLGWYAVWVPCSV